MSFKGRLWSLGAEQYATAAAFESTLGGSEYDERSISMYDHDDAPAKGLEEVRSAVTITKEAVRAISITALEAVRGRGPIHGSYRL